MGNFSLQEYIDDYGEYGGYSLAAMMLSGYVMDRDLDAIKPEYAKLPISRQRVYGWTLRRAYNHIPGTHRITTKSGKSRNMFKFSEILEWYRNYIPGKGGRPFGT